MVDDPEIGDCTIKIGQAPVSPKCDLEDKNHMRETTTREWLEWAGEMVPSHFYASDLAGVRLELHSRGLCPKAPLNGMGSVKSVKDLI